MKRVRIFRTVFSLLLSVALLAGVFVFVPASDETDPTLIYDYHVGKLVCMHNCEIIDKDGDDYCDYCGEKIVYDIMVGTPTELYFNESGEAVYLRFVPEADGAYRGIGGCSSDGWMDQDMNLLMKPGDIPYGFDNYVPMKAGKTYYLQVRYSWMGAYTPCTAEMKIGCRHVYEFTDLNGDCICDDCGERIIYPWELGDVVDVTLAPDSYIYAKVTTGDAAAYSLLDSGEWLNEDFTPVAGDCFTNHWCTALYAGVMYVMLQGNTTYYCRTRNETDNDKTVTFNFTTCAHEGEKTEYTANEQEATCTSEGGFDTVTYCNYCGCDIEKVHTSIDKLDHPDENNDGWCDVCNAELTPHDNEANKCKYCGGVHEGVFGKIIQFFHNILYFFKNLFGGLGAFNKGAQAPTFG